MLGSAVPCQETGLLNPAFAADTARSSEQRLEMRDVRARPGSDRRKRGDTVGTQQRFGIGIDADDAMQPFAVYGRGDIDRLAFRVAARIIRLIASSQNPRLLDPVLFLDTALDTKALADAIDVRRRPRRDIREAQDAKPGQALLEVGIDRANTREIVDRLACNERLGLTRGGFGQRCCFGFFGGFGLFLGGLCGGGFFLGPGSGGGGRSSRGRDSRARPIATICCSPPDKVPATWRRRSFTRGSIAYTRSRSASMPARSLRL